MKFYHGTTEANWEKIQKEGVLWGRPNTYHNGRKLSRVTWMSVLEKDAGIYDQYGLTDKKCVMLEIDAPKDRIEDYNEQWQVTVYEPIPIGNIKRIR